MFSSASICKKGSLTVEAALVLPVFLMAAVTFMTPFSIMNRERRVQAAVESVCEEMSRYAYLNAVLKQNKTKLNLPKEFVQQFGESGMTQTLLTAYAQVQVRQKLNGYGIGGISLLQSQLLEDGEMLDLVVHYKLKLPFSVFGKNEVHKTVRSRRRGWIGKDGGRGDGGSGAGDEEEIVYVGKNSHRYHEQRTCHYLDNQLIGVSLEEVGQYRNAGGGKYHPCARCGAQGGTSVYIMPSGDRYHTTASCSAIIAYVRAVKKSEVAYLGACSYCSGGRK
ncbi:MAG: hypothetical protein RR466_04530 [Hungatella sp.]